MILDLNYLEQVAYDEGYKARDDEIVRCKDCYHYRSDGRLMVCEARGIPTAETDFCSWGTRRD